MISLEIRVSRPAISNLLGNSGDKLLVGQTREIEWYYQIEKGFCQASEGAVQSDSKALESVRRELYDNLLPGGGDAMASVLGK